MYIYANKLSVYAIGYRLSSGTSDPPSEPFTYYTIKASAGTGGSISPSGSASVAYGDSITYAITPDEGYSISYVLVDDVNVGAVSSYTFRNVTQSHAIRAVFVKNAGCRII
ncbi:MAG: InlB B-repeat-containing protein [Eubacteriales bacterium]